MTTMISWSFMGYYLILFAERLQSLIRIGPANFFRSGFDGYVNILTAAALLAVPVLLAFQKDFWRSLIGKSKTPDYTLMAVTAGVLLTAGMAYTEYTIQPVQFVSYGVIIVGMILRTVQVTRGKACRFGHWYSLAFITALSMAIPVVYPTALSAAVPFYLLEASVSLALVAAFTILLQKLMTGNGGNLIWWVPTAVIAAGNTAILIMQWQETVNIFILIFGIITIAMFIAGKILLSSVCRCPRYS